MFFRPTIKNLRRAALYLIFISATVIFLQTLNSAYFSTSNLTSELKTVEENSYSAALETCLVPDVDPHHGSILELLHPLPPIICSTRDPLTYTAAENGSHWLVVDASVVSQYTCDREQLVCCYSVIIRETENMNIESDCINFTLKTVLEVGEEFLFVRCVDKSNDTEVYTNMHAVVHKKTSEVKNDMITDSDTITLVEEDDVKTTPYDESPRHLSVLLLGIDSMSRLNFLRTMPKTAAHLNANDWLAFRGYNKIGDNTIPNLLPMLTGFSPEQIKKVSCHPDLHTNIDKCPLIWKDFHNHGYFTAYAEDVPVWSTFNWKKGGFLKQPTDYYFRPFTLSAARKLPVIWSSDDLELCLGPTSTTKIFLKLTLDLVRAHNKLFSFIWINNISHNDHNIPVSVDELFLDFMEELKGSGALNTTAIFFLSDHGSRYGDIRQTYVGWLEERLPVFFMWLPEWFRESHPQAYQNLKDRRDVMTSPYDVHLTLKEIVDEKIGKSDVGSEGCPTCRSMFTTPVKNRSCEDAGVTAHWCACATQTPASTSSESVLNATKTAVDAINNKLEAGNHTSLCAYLTLKTILNARSKVTYGMMGKRIQDYVIVFTTLPGLAVFDATVRDHAAHGRYEVLGLISRISSYEADSKCMKIKEFKLYCHCIVN